MNNTGNAVAVAGLLVIVLNHFGINVAQTDVEAIVGAGLILYGIIHQAFTHKNELQAVKGI